MNDQSEERPGWGGWDYVPEERTGAVDDPVEAFLEGTNFGVRGRGNTWQVVQAMSETDFHVDDQVWPTAVEAMREAERRASDG